MTLSMALSMAFWQLLLVQVAATGLTVLLVMAGFYRWVLRPYLERKVKELADIAEGIEPRVTRSVKTGVSETLRELPESSMRDSTKQIFRFGSDLMENGLSSFLGGSEELRRRSRASRNREGEQKQPASDTPGDGS